MVVSGALIAVVARRAVEQRRRGAGSNHASIFHARILRLNAAEGQVVNGHAHAFSEDRTLILGAIGYGLGRPADLPNVSGAPRATAQDANVPLRAGIAVVATPPLIDRRSGTGAEDGAFVVGRAGVAVVAGAADVGRERHTYPFIARVAARALIPVVAIGIIRLWKGHAISCQASIL